MSAPHIELEIERLVLHDLPPTIRRLVAAAVEQELVRLIAERGVPPRLVARGGAALRTIPAITVPAGLKPAAIGARVAEAIYAGLADDRTDKMTR